MNYLLSLLICCTVALSAAELSHPVQSTHPKTGVTILKGTVQVPYGDAWYFEKPFEPEGGLTEFYAEREESIDADDFENERMAKLADRRSARSRQHEIRRAYWMISSKARQGNGIATVQPDEVEKNPVQGVYMRPDVRLYEAEQREGERWRRRATNEENFLFDTRPAIDDGKHWIFSSWGGSRREKIDVERMSELGLTIKPQAPSALTKVNPKRNQPVDIKVYARVLSGDKPGTVTRTLRNHYGSERIEVVFKPEAAQAGDAEICTEWAVLRCDRFGSALEQNSPLTRHWLQQTMEQYDIDRDEAGFWLPDRDRRPTLNAMSLLGGRTAIEETLQRRNIAPAKVGEANIAISDIEGVEVKSHPFKAMLGDSRGGRLALAEWVPHDHFFIHFPSPEGLAGMMGGGTEFLHRSGSVITGNANGHRLKSRYLNRFGINEELLKRFLESGIVSEMAVVMPDLHLIDGTEVSTIMRIGKPLFAAAALGIIGVPPGKGTHERKTDSGTVYYHREDDLLIVSSSERELAAIRAARATGKSLGMSDEFRYMLTKLPVSDNTTAYVYFSDPFIRHLTGPAAKIGQLRRIQARAELERTSSAALLAAFDGHTELDREDLETLGYLQPVSLANDLSVDESQLSHSPEFGRPGDMRSLTERPAERASAAEKQAYDAYRDAYSRLWRRFFDPIAVRVEDHGNGAFEMETFILPLIDNSIYNTLRAMVPPEESAVPLPVPVFDKPPISLLSFNLGEDRWLALMEDAEDFSTDALGVDGGVFNLLGPDIHMAVQDSDPIITFGNGELVDMAGMVGGRGFGNDMVGIAFIGSMLTRPCQFCVGVQNTTELRKELDLLAGYPLTDNDRFGNGQLSKVKGKEQWIYRYTIEGIITLRFGLSIQDRYLVINNQPFSNHANITGSEPIQEVVGHLQLHPGACDRQLPALFASAMEKSGDAAAAGATELLPLLIGQARDKRSVAAAQQRHFDLFGFTPLHPSGGSWKWDADEGGLISSQFGAAWNVEQPAFDATNQSVGLFQGVRDVNLGMKFEEDGLRSRVRWNLGVPK